jgi:SWIM zinc finger
MVNQQERSVVRIKHIQRASRTLNVIPEDPEHGRYMVQSVSVPERYYNVRIDPETLTGQCTCPWGSYGGINCKHVLAVLRTHYTAKGCLSFWRSRHDAYRQHRPVIDGNHMFATIRPHRRSI